MKQSVHYMQIVPNSHSYGSLGNILVEYEYRQKHTKKLTKKYMLIGLRNTLKRKYEIRIIGDANMDYKNNKPVFTCVQDIITYIESENYHLKKFIKIIQNTLNGGHDLKCKRKMERKEVYECIDTERQYQDLRWSPRREANDTPDESKPPAEWINYIEFHLNKAKEEVYYLRDDTALAEVRKVAALAVRCLELFGCPERVIPEELLNQE